MKGEATASPRINQEESSKQDRLRGGDESRSAAGFFARVYHRPEALCDLFDSRDQSLGVCLRIIQISMVRALDAVGEQDILLRIMFVFRVFAEDYFLEFTVETVSQMILLLAGKQDLDQGDL